ncbi:MAG: hypothetical protein AABZ62_05175, partial [Planctomycetota bacterium]
RRGVLSTFGETSPIGGQYTPTAKCARPSLRVQKDVGTGFIPVRSDNHKGCPYNLPDKLGSYNPMRGLIG